MSDRALAEDVLRGLSADQIELVKLLLEEESRQAQTIQPRPRQGKNGTTRLQVSWAQRRLWFVDQLEGGRATYTIPIRMNLRGALDPRSLQRALDALLERHEVLRTVFVSDNGEPLQEITPPASFPLDRVDLVHCAPDERERQVRLHEAQNAAAPFDLRKGPLISGRLLRRDAHDHVLLLRVHHIVFDGWSLGVLVKDLGRLYAAAAVASDGVPGPLRPLAIQYADYAQWQREWLSEETCEPLLKYWRTRLQGAPPQLGLPTDRPRPAVPTYRGEYLSIGFDAQLTARLRALAQRHKATLFMVLCAGWALLLSRLSGQSEVVIGTPVANRDRGELEDLIGFFVNMLPLRVPVRPDTTVEELIDEVKNLALDAYAHQDLPFERIVDDLQPRRVLGCNPIFQAIFALQNAPATDLDFPQLAVTLEESGNNTAMVDLSLSCYERGEEIFGVLSYASDLFDRDTIVRWSQCLTVLFGELTSAAGRRVSELTILTPSERRTVLEQFNPRGTLYSPVECIHELFQRQVQRAPRALAATCDGQSLSYGELNSRANRLARHLRARGVGPDELVGVCLERSLEMLVAILGVLKAGGAYVPLDPTYPAGRLAYMVADARPRVLLTQSKLRELLPSTTADVIALDEASASLEREAETELPAVGLQSHHLAYVIYTSGSTGEPKGVTVEHRNVTRLFHATDAWFKFGERDVWTLFHSFAFDFSVWEIWGALLYGGRVVIVPNDTARSPRDFYRLLCDEGVTVLNQTPSAFTRLIDAQRNEADPGRQHALRVVIFGGEALEFRALRPWVERNGARTPQLVNMYGITETTVHVTYRALSGEDIATERGSLVGRPIPDLSVYVLDAAGQPVPIGVIGEMYVGGAGVARGYLNRPELTRSRFATDPFAADPRARMYRTGDLGRWRADGTLEYLGRNDQQVKIRGFRIELGEIEAQLAKCVGVKEAVVLPRGDTQADKRLVAYVVPAANGSVGPEVLRSYLQSSLPDYMVPSAFVLLERLPLTRNGKLDREALPAPDAQAVATRQYVAPRTELERTLCALWSEVLAVEQVGVEDNFFALGGDSILSLRVVARAEATGLALHAEDLFRNQDVVQLARTIEARTAGAIPRRKVEAFELLSPAERQQFERLPDVEDAYPLSRLQEGMYFHSELAPDSAVYHDIVSYCIEAPFDERSFEQAILNLVQRHPVLRSAFGTSCDQRLLQIVHRQVPTALQVLDLSNLGDHEQEAHLAQWLEKEKHRSFVWSRPPLLRMFVHVLGKERFEYTLSFHHAILDGWSVASLQTELLGDYAALTRGEERVIAAPKAMYRDFVARERAALESSAKEYWERLLQEVDLSPANPKSALGEVRTHELRFEPQIGAGLLSRAQQIGAPLRTLLLAAHVKVMAVIGGGRAVLTGVVSHGRAEEEDGDRVLGLHLNSLPLRLDVPRGSWRHLAMRVRELENEMLPHRHYPLAAMPGAGQLFDTLFNFNRFHVYRRIEAGVNISKVRGFEQTSFAMVANFSQELTGTGLLLTLTFAEARYGRREIERIAGYYKQAITHLCEAFDSQHDERTLLSPEEQREVLEDFNDTSRAFPADRSVHELFAEQVARQPGATAVVHAGASISYTELNRRANQLARYLREQGVRIGECVPIFMVRSTEMLVAELAVLKCGGTYVPIDVSQPIQRTRFMLQDCAARRFIAGPALGLELDANLACRIDYAEVARAIGDYAGDDPRANDGELPPAYVMYTSGSTGEPKGVAIPHRGISRLVCNNTYVRFEPRDCVVHCSNPAFDASTFEVWGALLNGARVLIVEQSLLLEPTRFAALLQAQRADTMFLTVALFNRYAREIPQALGALKYLLVGGDALDPRVVREYLQGASGRHVINGYGPTECTTFAICGRVTEVEEGARGIPLGRPISNTRVYILDPELLPVPVGTPGEIHIGGPGVALGYLNRPELTAERFIPSPFIRGDRLYKTGDIGRWRVDGVVEFLGRADHQVKIRGFRIELGEIEAQLARHPQVKEGVVLAREDTPGEKRLIAYVVMRQVPGLEPPGVESLRAHVSSVLPEYMVPSAFVLLESLPLTRNGKLDRKALPAPEAQAYACRAYESPQGEIEEALARIWQQVLSVERVGRHDNFFELGGHSLLAVTLIERMRQEGLHTDIRALYNSPTPCELAAQVEPRAPTIEVPENRIVSGCERITPEMLPLITLTQEQIDRVVEQVPGGAANVQDVYPLAPLQEGILFHHLMAGRGDVYLLTTLLAFDARERAERFIAALAAVMERHDILRTAILWEGLPEPLQVVWRRVSLPVEEVTLGPGDVAQQLRERFDPRRFRLDVTRAPLQRVYLAFDAANQRWLLLLLSHHLIVDHTALQVLAEEVRTHLLDQRDRLGDPIPFRCFVAQARLGISPAAHEQFFRQMLGDIDEPTAPFGLLDVQGEGRGVTEARLAIRADLAKRARARARAAGVAPASLWHLAWSQVLARLTGRKEVVFGTVLFGRLQGLRGSERAVGLFINTLPLRLSVDGVGAHEALRAAHHSLGDLLRHEHASLAMAQRCSAVPAQVPLFTTLLNYRYVAADVDDADRNALEGITPLYGEERTNYPITLSVDDVGDGFAVTAHVTAPLSAERICALVDFALGELVQTLELAPNAPIRDVDVLPRGERQQVLTLWNRTEVPYPGERCIHELFEDQVSRTPQALAVTCRDRTLTYAELNVRANRLAHYLRERGVGTDQRVGLCVRRDIPMVVAMLAIMKAGGAYVALDPSYPRQRLAYLVADSAPVLLLTDAASSQALAELAHSPPVIDLEADAPQWAHFPGYASGTHSRSRAVAYVIYTSGSTGEPKGVAIEHANAVNLLSWAQRAFDPSVLARTLFSTSINFDLAVYECFVPLASGASIRIVANALDLISEPADVTLINTVPSTVRALIEAQALPQSVLAVNLAGEALKQDLTESIFTAGVPSICNLYGPSETTTYSTWIRMEPTTGFLNSIGRPIANTQIYILDEWLRPTPLGVAGELFIGGAGVARGYLNRPRLTAERFVANPFADSPGERMYRTGDLGRWRADGSIEFLGRNDHQVKIRGFRIELEEIEKQLLEHALVREAVVLAREDAAGGMHLVAYLVVRQTSGPPTDEMLRLHLESSLPCHMVPSAFVLLDSFPLTPNGKLDRKALPSPEVAERRSHVYAAPEGVVEQTLAQIWQEILKTTGPVSRDDDFFELGGHSLSAVQVVSRVRTRLGAMLALRDLFEHSTLRGLASALSSAKGSGGTEIERVSRQKTLLASSAQQRLWFLARLHESASRAYHLAFSLRLEGELDADALRRAFEALIERHETLRTTFAQVDGRAAQIIAEPGPFRLPQVDLCEMSSDERESNVARLGAEMASEPLDLGSGPLFRARLLILSAREQLLLITMHHIISDGWSMGVLIRELDALYEAFRQGKANPLPPLEIQYADFAHWQHRCAENGEQHKHAAYWAEQLRGAPPLLMLPTDRPRPAVQSYRGDNVGWVLSKEPTAGLKSLAQRLDATLFMVLYAGFAILLARLSGQKDLVIGTPVANRSHPQVEGLIGLFVNTLPLRVRVESGMSVRELIERIKTLTLEALEHQELSFDQIVEVVQPARHLSHSPIFQGLLTLQNAPLGAPKQTAGGPVVRPILQSTAQFDLAFTLDEEGDGLVGSLNYASDLFSRATLERWSRCFSRVLCAMAEDPEQLTALLPLLDPPEQCRLAVGLRASTALLPPRPLVHALFEAQVERSPEAVALVYADQLLTYADLEARANQLARYLREKGVGPDKLVGLCVERSVEMVVGLLGILKAGGAYVPLDPGYPPERLLCMLEDAAPTVLLTQEHLRNGLPRVTAETIALDERWNEIARQSSSRLSPQEVAIDGRNLAYVIFTSGSTGKPKGAMNEHRAVVNRLQWMQDRYHLDAQDRVLQKTPFSFDVSVWEFFWPLMSGARLIVARPQGHRDPTYLGTLIRATGVTTLHFVPSMLHSFIEHPGAGECSSLRHIVCSGEELSGALQRKCLQTLPRARLSNLYGPTEAAVDVTAWECTLEEEDVRVPIGGPITNIRLYILDEYLQLTPLGIPGEIYIGGVGVGRGYLRRPQLTAERFVANPFAAGERLYKTGDLGRWRTDGNIEYLGRNDHQVKIRGFRIELGEIEAQLGTHPRIKDAVVLAREDATGARRLVAYVTEHLAGDASQEPLGAEELRGHLKAVLPEHMVPAAYVRLDGLPLTPNGKLDRAALPNPEDDAYSRRQYEAPQGAVEEVLAAAWRKLLGVDRIGRHDNFFELGGHSLMAITLIEQLRRAGLHADIRALFSTQTLAQLAEVVAQCESPIVVPDNPILAGCGHITPQMLPLIALEQAHIDRIVEHVPGGAVNVQDIYPLAPLQEGMLFHYLLRSRGDAYVMPTLLAFDTRERLDHFLSAVQAIIARHDMLRTAILWEELPEPVQVVWRRAQLPVQIVKTTGPDAERQLREQFDPSQFRMDLRVAPPLRAYVSLDEAHGRWLLLLHKHHLALENMTLDILQEELQAHLLQEQHTLPAPVPFRDFVARARLELPTAEHEKFFRETLGDIDQPTAPFGVLDVEGVGPDIAETRLLLDDDLCRRIRRCARTHGVSAASLFHLAVGLVLARLTSQRDVVFGTVLFGRLQGVENAQRGFGLYSNVLPLRLSLARCTALEALQVTHESLGRLLLHEHASLALARRCCAVPAPVPLFTTLLNYRHAKSSADPARQQRAFEGMTGLYDEIRIPLPLLFVVNDFGERFMISAHTAAPISSEHTCELLHTALERLLDAVERTPDVAISNVDVMSGSERELVLRQWNDTATSPTGGQCLHELFEGQVRATPHAVAVTDRDETLTYESLNARANRLAHYLRELGVGPDARVALSMERGIPLVVGLLAVLKAGGACVPLDPGYPTARRAYMLEDSGARLILTPEFLCGAEKWANYSPDNLPPAAVRLEPRHLAYVLYTSGSTGAPKGVAMPHAALANLLTWHIGKYSSQHPPRVLQLTSISFDVSFQEIFSCLLCGGELIVVGDAIRTDPRALLDFIRERAIDVLFATHALLEPLAEQVVQPEIVPLKTVFQAGEAMRLTPAIARWLAGASQLRLHNHYGPTEAHVATAFDLPAGRPATGELVSIGKPIANVQTYILDQYLRPAGRGVAGEIYIGGAGLARGYWNRPEWTAERFIANPYGEPGSRLYRTGDRGRWCADGTIEFLGRDDEQLKIRGYRVELGEIEVRLREHPKIREAVVSVQEGSGRRLVAYYTLRVGTDALAPEAIRRHLQSVLPAYMVPAAYVRLEELPKTPTGKTDRRALPVPDAPAHAHRDYEEPCGEVEQALAQIWRELLQVERVGRHDDFFDLGGHSLLIMRLYDTFERLGARLPLNAVIQHPTVARLAASIAQSRERELVEADLVTLRAQGEERPLFLVHEITGEVSAFGPLARRIRAGVPIQGLRLTAPSLVGSIKALARHHLLTMQRSQPQGPYRVAGHSFGGLVAYEIASQLIQQGEEVEFVGLIDTSLPGPAAVSAFAMNADPVELGTAHASLAASEGGREVLRRWIDNSEACRGAYLRYRPRALATAVHLFVADHSIRRDYPKGWVELLGDAARLHPLPGTHGSILREPHVAGLAAALSAALQPVHTSRATRGTGES